MAAEEAEIVAIRKIPVLSVVSPDYRCVPLGLAAAECEASVIPPVDFSEIISNLERRIVADATNKFNGAARIVCNFTWTFEERIWPTRHYQATGDVYGEEIIDE
jgi:hypothetical protein